MSLEHRDMPLGRTIGLIAKRYIGILYNQLKHLGVGPYFIVLVITERTNGTLTQQEIADASGLDKTNVLRIIDNLSEKQLLIRVPKPDDRRAYLIQLTEGGKEIMPNVNTAINELNKACFNGISQEEIDAFYRIMDKINNNMELFPDEGLDFSIKDNT